MAIAGATTAVVSPYLVPVAILGSTAPDWLETVANRFFGQNFTHRQETHYLTHWLFAMAFFATVYDYHFLGLAFAYGGFTHVICDSLTVSGIPFSPMSHRRFHLFGGRLTTGAPGEYIVSGITLMVCFFLVNTLGVGVGFYPFFYDWGGFYDDGLLDASEWKKNRFKLI